MDLKSVIEIILIIDVGVLTIAAWVHTLRIEKLEKRLSTVILGHNSGDQNDI